MSARAEQKTRGSMDCVHCGTPFRADRDTDRFCCSGCEYVYRLIHGGDLDRFYDLRGSRRVPPPTDSVFRPGRFVWLQPLVRSREADGGARCTLTLSLQGISCLGCVWLVERIFSDWPGAVSARVAASTGEVTLAWRAGACDLSGFARRLQQYGYTVGPPRDRRGEDREDGLRPLTWRIGVSAACAMNAMLFTLPSYLGMEAAGDLSRLFDAMAFVFATGAFLAGGSFFINRAWQALRRGALHIDLPISLGLILAYLASVGGWMAGHRDLMYFDFVAVFAFLMLGGRWLQLRAVERNRLRLSAEEVDIGPVTRVDADGGVQSIAPGEVRSGDRLRIPPGAHFPARARIESARATLGLAWINGESDPREFLAGQTAPSGAVNLGAAPVECEAVEAWSESLLAALLAVPAGDRPAGVGGDRLIRHYLVAVLATAAVGGAAWLAMDSPSRALQVVVSVLVVSCPCSLGIALPFVEDLAVSRLRRDGVFVRTRDLLARLGRVTDLVLDKTGTVTLEAMRLLNPEALRSLTPDERDALARLAGSSAHPASLAIHDHLLTAGWTVATVAAADDDPPSDCPGHGVAMRRAGVEWRLGRPGWAAGAAGAGDSSTCVFSRDGHALARMRFAEDLRDHAARLVESVEAQGRRVHILSGDRTEKVRAMARVLGLSGDRAHGDMSPEDKAAFVRRLDPGRTCLIGDGANDSLAFDLAACTGTPAIDRALLRNKSDFYFTGRSLDGIRGLFAMGDRHAAARRVAIVFAIAYNVIAIGVCLAGWMNPLLAAILMPASSMVTLWLVWRTMRLTPEPATA